jgi:hypothetical protein
VSGIKKSRHLATLRNEKTPPERGYFLLIGCFSSLPSWRSSAKHELIINISGLVSSFLLQIDSVRRSFNGKKYLRPENL